MLFAVSNDEADMTPPHAESPRMSWLTFAVIAGFSTLAVYCTFVSIHTMDVDTGAFAAKESLKQYRQALDGIRDFPYQWRLLGVYLVYTGERLTGLAPHTIDVVLKTLLLCVSSSILFVFSGRYTSAAGALCAVALYLVLTIAGFTDQYSIYFTNDYAMVALWFAAVYAVRERQYGAAAALTFVGAFAKETMLLVPVLIGLRFLRKQATLGHVAMAGLAFVIPTVILRWTYPGAPRQVGLVGHGVRERAVPAVEPLGVRDDAQEQREGRALLQRALAGRGPRRRPVVRHVRERPGRDVGGVSGARVSRDLHPRAAPLPAARHPHPARRDRGAGASGRTPGAPESIAATSATEMTANTNG